MKEKMANRMTERKRVGQTERQKEKKKEREREREREREGTKKLQLTGQNLG